MSDAYSGISFGQMFPNVGVPGNMSAAQASAGYTGPAAYSQNYLNNLFATTQASLNANAQRMVDWARSPAAGAYGASAGSSSWDNGDSFYWRGGTGGVFDQRNAGTGLTISQLQQPWLTPSGGANNVIGGGVNNPFSGGSLPPSTSYTSSPTGGNYYPAVNAGFDFSKIFNMPSVNDFRTGGMAGAGLGGVPSLDWTKLFQGGGGGGFSSGGLSSLGGLGGAPYTPSPSGGALDWTKLYSGSGGGAKTDPFPNMAMPGGLNQPMVTPQQPPQDFGSLFGRSVGGTAGAPQTPQPAAPLPQEEKLSIAGGLGGAPYTPNVSSLDFTKLFGGTETAAPAATPSTAPAAPAAPSGRSFIDDYFNPNTYAPSTPSTPQAGATGGAAPASAAAPADTAPAGGALTPGGGLKAADLADQARERLARLMAQPKEPSTEDIFGGDKPVPTEGQPGAPKIPEPPAVPLFPLPARRPDEATAAEAPAAETPFDRPSLGEFQKGRPDTVDTSLAGRRDLLTNTLQKELAAQDLVMTSSYRDPSDPLSRANPRSAHTQGLAFDVRARTPEQADTAISKIRELLDTRGLQRGEDYRIIDEVRSPSGHATGPHVHVQFTDQGMEKYQRNVYQDPNPPRPSADIPVPIPQVGGAAPAADRQVYQDQNVPRPQVALGTTGKDLGYLPGRSAEDLKGVNPQFTKALKEYAQQYNASQDDYDLVVRSGRLGRPTGEHAHGNAIDINLIDRRNGERLTDYQTRDPVVFKAYQDNANQFHQFLEKNYPDLAQVHRWGGYFSGPAGFYGAQDIMHHDLGGSRHGMAGGSWNQGLGQSQADLFELPTGGGIKNPYPQFNFDWSKAPIPDVGPMPLTYKSPGGGSVYQYDPATGQKVNVPLTWDPVKRESSMGELPDRPFVPAAPAGAQPPRFGGGFGGDEFSGQLPTAGAFTPYPGWREGGRFENRTEEQLGQDTLKALEARGFGYDPSLLEEPAETPLGIAAGLKPRASLPDVGAPLVPSGGQVSPGITDLFKLPPSGSALPEVARSPVGGEFSPGVPGLNEYARKFWTQNTRDENSPVEYRTASPLVNITKQDIDDAITFTEAFSGDLKGKENWGPALGGVFMTPEVDTSLSDKPHPDPFTAVPTPAGAGAATRDALSKVVSPGIAQFGGVPGTQAHELRPGAEGQQPGTPEWYEQSYQPTSGPMMPRGPETLGGAGRYAGFNPSGNVEDRRAEMLGREQLAKLQAEENRDPSTLPPTTAWEGTKALFNQLRELYGPKAAVSPLGREAGLETLQNTPLGTGRGGQSGQAMRAAGDESEGPDFNATFDAFKPAAIEGEAGRGGMVGRPATFDQQGPTQPGWQSSLGRDFARPELQQYSMPDTLAALERLRQRHGIPPEAVINIAGVEGSRWDPRYHSLGSSGIFQMNPPDFQEDGRSRPLGGLTFDEYANRATPAQQVDAYSDYIANSRNYPALDYAAGSNDPALYSALLQAMQFSPMRTTWAEELAAGNTSFPTHYNPPRAATELQPTSIDAMREAFARRIAAFPPSGTLPGGR